MDILLAIFVAILVVDDISNIKRIKKLEQEVEQLKQTARAEWIEIDFGELYECSNCGFTTEFHLSTYCQKCGALMERTKSND